MFARLSNTCQRHGFMQNSNRVHFVAEVFERQEDLADRLGSIKVAVTDRLQQLLRQSRIDANACDNFWPEVALKTQRILDAALKSANGGGGAVAP